MYLISLASTRNLVISNPPIRDIEIIFQHKWKIASDQPCSGNTKNIGSVKELDSLKFGTGQFAKLGEEKEVIFGDTRKNI